MFPIRINPSQSQIADKELAGVMARAHELYVEMVKEYEEIAEGPEVGERCKNLFHEVLVKLRSAFDMTMWRVWDKYGRPNLPATRNPPHVYFPICESQIEFERGLAKIGLSDLQRRNPAVFEAIQRMQPFSTRQQHWVQLRDLTNLGKHVALARQIREFKPFTRFVAPDGSIHMWSAGGVKMSGEDYHGVPITAATGLPTAGLQDITLKIEQVVLDGERISSPDFFCGVSIEYTGRIIANVLANL